MVHQSWRSGNFWDFLLIWSYLWPKRQLDPLIVAHLCADPLISLRSPSQLEVQGILRWLPLVWCTREWLHWLRTNTTSHTARPWTGSDADYAFLSYAHVMCLRGSRSSLHHTISSCGDIDLSIADSGRDLLHQCHFLFIHCFLFFFTSNGHTKQKKNCPKISTWRS